MIFFPVHTYFLTYSVILKIFKFDIRVISLRFSKVLNIVSTLLLFSIGVKLG